MNVLLDKTYQSAGTDQSILILLFCAVCLLMPASAQALDCDTSDGFPNIRLESQSEVDNFQDVYGPCDTITRDLIIGDENGPFSNLFGLAGIISITGDLIITRTSVASIEGLSNLQNIGGELLIESQLAGSFANLTGFSSLTSLKGLHIRDTNFLYSLSGLHGLASLEYVQISNARILTNLQGLPQGSIENQTGSSIGQSAKLAILPPDLGFKRLSLSSNDQLQSLDGAPPTDGLQVLTISENNLLQSLDGLSPTTSMQVLSLSENPELSDISALAGSSYDQSNPHPIAGSIQFGLEINSNPKLNNLDGIPTLPPALHILQIEGAPSLTNLDFLDGLLEVWEYAAIFSNPVLGDCSGLTKVVDAIDDGYPGPNEFTTDPTINPPDFPNEALYLESNAQGCNSIAEILDSGNGSEDVFKDSFETVEMQ